MRVQQRELDVLQSRRARKQVESLKHEANLTVADRRQLVVRKMRHIAAVEQIPAAGRLIQAAEDVHEGRLPRPRGSDDRHEFAAVNLERDATERVHGRRLHGVRLREVVNG